MTVINNQMAKELLNEFKVDLFIGSPISLAAPYAGAWLTTPPMDPLFVMHDTHFALLQATSYIVLHFQSCRSLDASTTQPCRESDYQCGKVMQHRLLH